MITMTRTDEGEATAQTVIVVPVVLLVLWLAIQATVLLHGANVASAAANEGAAVAARYGSSAGAGERAIERTLTALGSTSHGAWVVKNSDSSVVATVRLRLPRIFPFFPLTVSRSAHESVEKFMTEDQR
jgi:Flp pilus assembly protein TadG